MEHLFVVVVVMFLWCWNLNPPFMYSLEFMLALFHAEITLVQLEGTTLIQYR